MEECEVAGNEVVGDSSGLVLQVCESASNWLRWRWRGDRRQIAYQNIDLSVQDILGLLEGVVGRSGGASLDLVEAGGEV